MTQDVANAEQAQEWNGPEGAHWVEHQDRYDAMMQRLTPHLLGGADVAATDRVLDVGCGCGETTRRAAREAVRGSALGVDLSAVMLEQGRRRAEEEGLTNVRFEQADVQVHPFSNASFDAAISRFGVMFFTDPVAAFSNVVRALRPGGRVAFLCWQDMANNEWIVVPGGAAAEHVPLPDLGGPDAPDWDRPRPAR